MRKIFTFGTALFWWMVTVFVGLALLLFILHLLRSHVPGFVGDAAANAEGLITPQG